MQGGRSQPFDFEIKSTQKIIEIGCNPLWFLKLKSKLLNFGQNSSLKEISRNTLNRFLVCEIKTEDLLS
jgi:hypothetical protein